MTIVGLDTSGPLASCAVLRDGEIVHLTAMNQGLTHSETIMPALDAAMQAAGLRCDQVDCFATVAGPGSFTGVRIGVCAAKGLAHAWNRSCARIDALEALAMNYQGFDGLACPILDARRGQVYCAAFDVSSGMPRRTMEDDAVALEEFIARLPGDCRLAFVGDGLPVHGEKIRALLGDRAFLPPANLTSLRTDAVGLLALAHPETWVPAHALQAVYLRKPQAERERMEKLNHV